MKKRKGKRGGTDRSIRHPFEVKRRAVKLFVEDGYPAHVVAEELGIGQSTLNAWARQYREQGEDALRPAGPRRGRPQASAAAKQKAVDLKRQNPAFGTPRISQLLRRMFSLPQPGGCHTSRKAISYQCGGASRRPLQSFVSCFGA